MREEYNNIIDSIVFIVINKSSWDVAGQFWQADVDDEQERYFR